MFFKCFFVIMIVQASAECVMSIIAFSAYFLHYLFIVILYYGVA